MTHYDIPGLVLRELAEIAEGDLEGTVDPLTPQASLSDRGIDSLSIAELLVRLEDETGHYFGLALDGRALLTVSDLIGAIRVE